MPFMWNLKKWLAVERDIYRASELQTLLKEKAGVYLSLQSVSALVNGTPNALRVETMQALCNALDCELHDFCTISPDAMGDQKQRKVVGDAPRKLYGGKKDPPPEEDSDDFPSPLDFRKPQRKPDNE